MDLRRWSPELRRALTRVRPEFFGWTPDRQLRYRTALPDEDHSAIVEFLVASVAGSDAVAAALGTREREGRLPLDLQNRINELLLPLTGIGDDAFFLNEHLGEGRSILDFPTLRAYDEDDHVFQERARAEEDASYAEQPYLGALHGCWARVLVGVRLTYLTLSMAAAYLYERISEAAGDELQRRIPHRHVRGPHDGERVGDMIRWDLRLDAGGHEAMLEEFQHRLWDYERERWRTLKAEYDSLALGGAYLLDDSQPGESNLLWVFTDKSALETVRFETFMADCRAISRPLSELESAAEVECGRVKQFVAEQHQDLLAGFDPKVVRMRKRRGILMHPRAFDGLADFDRE
jgi:hypothetical protein